MEKNTEFIRALNKDLELEFKSIVQYVGHIATVKGPNYQQTLNDLRAHLDQELRHAVILAEQIDFLGGAPSTSVPEIEFMENAPEALKQDLELETNQLARYRERVDQANKLNLPDVAEALSPLLRQTQDHVQDLQSALAD